MADDAVHPVSRPSHSARRIGLRSSEPSFATRTSRGSRFLTSPDSSPRYTRNMKDTNAPDLRRVTYCGLYCGLCLNGGRIPQRAAELRGLLDRVSIREWGPELPDFAEFWRFLERLAQFEARASCRERACGPDDCAIRDCASSRKLDACPFCGDYPCERIRALTKRYVTLLGDGERMREIGIDLWIQEQDARQARGFAYVDLRAEPPAP